MAHRGAKSITANALKVLAGVKALQERLERIAHIINTVEARCMSADGEVTSTKLEITDAELRKIWLLASKE